jgi:hypothetical protein
MFRTISLTAAILLTAAPAVAADEIGLSSDGVSWGSTLTQPLFDPAFRWVPGDRETTSFWVRNQSNERALLNVAILGSSIDSLMETGDLSVKVAAASGGGGSTTTTGRHELLSSRPVEPGQTERIDVTVAIDSASTNQSQVKTLDLQFEVRLTQDTGTPEVSDDSDDSDGSDNGGDDGDGRDRDGLLPGTGSSVDRAWLWFAAGLIGGGLAFVGWTRRKERSDV